MNQVRCGAEVRGEVRVLSYHRQGGVGAVIAIFANQFIYSLVFAESADAWSQYDQLSAIGHGHARAINRFVSQPRAVKFFGIEIHHSFADRLGHQRDVYLKT